MRYFLSLYSNSFGSSEIESSSYYEVSDTHTEMDEDEYDNESENDEIDWEGHLFSNFDASNVCDTLLKYIIVQEQ